MTNPYATPESTFDSVPASGNAPAYGGFWRRLGAAMIDGVFILPLFVLQYLLQQQGRHGQLYALVPIVVVPVLYQVLLVKRFAGTPGKRLLKMRITMADGTPVTWRAAVLRYLPWAVFGVLQGVGSALAALSMTDENYFSYGYVDRIAQLEALQPAWATYAGTVMKIWTVALLIAMLANKKRRTTHDFIAGTVVRRD